MALLRARRVLANMKFENDEEEMAAQILSRSLEEPLRIIASNAGVDGAK